MYAERLDATIMLRQEVFTMKSYALNVRKLWVTEQLQ